MKDALLLVFANKQDIPGGEFTVDLYVTRNQILANASLAMTPQEVSEKLDLNNVAKNHIWKVEPSCATTGEGIFEGLAWLSSNVKLPAK